MRVFVGDDTFCTGFQFRRDGSPRPAALALFHRAMDLKVPHNYFTVWTVVAPSTSMAAGLWTGSPTSRPWKRR